MQENAGILLTDGFEEYQTYRIVTSQGAQRYRVTIVEEPPQRRLLHMSGEFENGETTVFEKVFDLPLPWVYTYLKFADTKRGRQLWQTCVFFSGERITRPTEQQVYTPYIPNVQTDGQVCWGEEFDRDIPDNLDVAVRRCLQNFWMRNFNDDVNPVVESQQLHTILDYFGHQGVHIPLENALEEISRHSVEEILAIPLAPENGFIFPEQFWLPNFHAADHVLLNARSEFDDDEDDGDWIEADYDEAPRDGGW